MPDLLLGWIGQCRCITCWSDATKAGAGGCQKERTTVEMVPTSANTPPELQTVDCVTSCRLCYQHQNNDSVPALLAVSLPV